MSEAPTVDETKEPQAPIDPPPSPSSAFAELMDTLVGDEDGKAAAEGGAPAAADADAKGPATPSAEGTGAEGVPAGAPASGDGGKPEVPTAGDATAAGKDTGATAGTTESVAAGSGTGTRPADWTAEPAALTAKLGELSNALEERVAKAYHEQALAAVKEEHKPYFDALNKHPRMLIGEEVPSLKGEGMERLKDAEDAKSWQDAVKSLLVEEVRDRSTRGLEESQDYLTTIHSSIELFQNNHDLIPGGKDFNVELANKFAEMAKPYELRIDGKLQGYSIPVQPIINQLRTDLAATSSQAPAAPAAGKPGAVEEPPAPGKADPPPQAGIQSKAGNSSDDEGDFSTLFGTIGLPNLRI